MRKDDFIMTMKNVAKKINDVMWPRVVKLTQRINRSATMSVLDYTDDVGWSAINTMHGSIKAKFYKGKQYP